MVFIIVKAGSSKEELFDNMLQKAEEQEALPQELARSQQELVQVLMSREKIGDTCVAPGIALAHAIFTEAKKVFLLAGILDRDMDWDGENQVSLVFMLVIPGKPDEAGMVMTKKLMSNLADDDIAAAMVQARTSAELKQLFNKVS